ncbi:MAG: formylglycine-generating enzyme family protein, partial [Pirellula sp.]
THDWYGEYEDSRLTDPLGAKTGSLRVSRGGSWGRDAARCRSAYRFRIGPSYRDNDFGFRVALSPSGIPKSPEADK